MLTAVYDAHKNNKCNKNSNKKSDWYSTAVLKTETIDLSVILKVLTNFHKPYFVCY